MFYREVPSSMIMPVSAAEERASVNSLEGLFQDYFFKKGSKYYSNYKSSYIQSNNTFLKDLIDNISKIFKEKELTDNERMVLNLTISSIQNQLKIIELVAQNLDVDSLNAAVCGTVYGHLKKLFS